MIGPQNISDEGTSLFCTQFYAIDDIIVEGTESFFVVMTPISNRVNPFQPEGNRIEMTIADDDGMHANTFILYIVSLSPVMLAIDNTY